MSFVTNFCNAHEGERPCCVAPHPDLVNRLAAASPHETAPSQFSFTSHHATTTVPGLNDGIIFPEHHASQPQSVAAPMSATATRAAPLRGPIRVIVVLVDFSDKVMGTSAPQYFNNLFFSTGTVSTGSVAEYYTDVSGGNISITGAVVGPYRMPNTLASYAKNSNGLGAQPNAQNLANDALSAVMNANINLAPYDNDKNGFVDAFIVVHAGRGAEQTGSAGDIWSHKWVLPQPVKTNDVTVYGYLTIPEDAFLGVCAHELGHLLFQWPDFYDTANFSIAGDGNWCLMAGGSWGFLPGNPQGTTPCHPSAWCKTNQGWVSLVTETANHAIALADVKTANREVHRLWTKGDVTSKEYFLIENRQQTGFDGSLPGPGLLVWHIDDSQTSNTNPNRFWVGLMQADGLNQLGTPGGGRGDAGDPFPGSTGKGAFNFASSPSSRAYSGQISGVSINSISAAASTMTMNVCVQPTAVPVYQQGQPGNGIGGYDMKNSADLSFAFDYDSSGKQDHIVLYRPGTGTIWILKNNGGTFTPVYQQGDPGNGIGGYDLSNPADLSFAFDYDSSGKQDHIVLYRPGKGTIWILKNNGGTFTPVYQQGDPGIGIGGYNLSRAEDRVFAFDYDSSGKQDHLCLYRPGTGTMWILKNNGGTFTPVYQQGDPGNGIGGFNLIDARDRAFAFDYDSSGKLDHLCLYRPGTGTMWILKNSGGTFTPVYQQGDPGSGTGGFNLKDNRDRAFAFDYNSSGKQDHIALYRPGTGTFWCLQKNSDGTFTCVVAVGDPGSGIGGYDLSDNADKIYAYDYDQSGKLDHLVVYRTNATGTIWIMKFQLS